MSLGEVESLPENERKLRELEEGCLEELKMVNNPKMLLLSI